MKDSRLHKGIVTEALPGTLFRVQLAETGSVVLCTVSGRMRINNIRVALNDTVYLVLSPDGGRGRIEKRLFT